MVRQTHDTCIVVTQNVFKLMIQLLPFIFMISHGWLTHSSIELMTAVIHELAESWLAQLMICVLLKLTIQLRLNL